MKDRDFAAVSTAAAFTANGDRHVVALADRPGQAEPAMAATAADTLCRNAVGLPSAGDDRAFALDGHRGAVVSRAAFTANADAQIAALRTVEGCAEAAAAAAAADALPADTRCAASDRLDITDAGDGNGASE